MAECAAERHHSQQHRISCIQSDTTRDVESVPRDGLLIVQDQFRPAGGARRRECQARHHPGRLIGAGVGCIAIERQHRQARELFDTGRKLEPKHATYRGTIFRRQRSENRREVHSRESPLCHDGEGTRASQEVAHFRHPKSRIDVDRKRTKPGAGKDCGQITGPVWQPQRDPSARTNARFA